MSSAAETTITGTGVAQAFMDRIKTATFVECGAAAALALFCLFCVWRVCCRARQRPQRKPTPKHVVGSGTAMVMEQYGKFRAVLLAGRHDVLPGDAPKKVTWFTSLMHQPRPTRHIKMQPFVVPCPAVTAPDETGADVLFEYDVVALVRDAQKAAYASDNMLDMAELCVRQTIVDFAAMAGFEDLQKSVRDSRGAGQFTGSLVNDFYTNHGVALTITMRTVSRVAPPSPLSSLPRRRPARLMRRSPERPE